MNPYMASIAITPSAVDGEYCNLTITTAIEKPINHLEAHTIYATDLTVRMGDQFSLSSAIDEAEKILADQGWARIDDQWRSNGKCIYALVRHIGLRREPGE